MRPGIQYDWESLTAVLYCRVPNSIPIPPSYHPHDKNVNGALCPAEFSGCRGLVKQAGGRGGQVSELGRSSEKRGMGTNLSLQDVVGDRKEQRQENQAGGYEWIRM